MENRRSEPLSGKRLSGLGEVESRSGGAEADFHGLGVIRVDGQVCRDQVGFELNGPGLGVVQVPLVKTWSV